MRSIRPSKESIVCERCATTFHLSMPCPKCERRITIDRLCSMYLQRKFLVINEAWLPNGSHPVLTYALRVGGYVKIGSTTNIRDRIVSLQIGNPYRLNAIGLVDRTLRVNVPGAHEERRAHELLDKAGARRAIGEWFCFDELVADAMLSCGLAWRLNERTCERSAR